MGYFYVFDFDLGLFSLSMETLFFLELFIKDIFVFLHNKMLT